MSVAFYNITGWLGGLDNIGLGSTWKHYTLYRSWKSGESHFPALYFYPNGTAQNSGTVYLFGVQVSDWPTGYIATSAFAIYGATNYGSTFPSGIYVGGNVYAPAISLNGDTAFSATPRMTFGGYVSAVNATNNYVVEFIAPKALTIFAVFATTATALSGCSPFPTFSVYDNNTTTIIESITWGTSNTSGTYPIAVTVPAGHTLILQTTAGTGCSGGGGGNITVEYTMQIMAYKSRLPTLINPLKNDPTYWPFKDIHESLEALNSAIKTVVATPTPSPTPAPTPAPIIEGLEIENGTAAGSQTILNLVAGTNITITDDGIGDITISTSGGSSGPNFSDEEVPVDSGDHQHFTLAHSVLPAASLILTLNGQILQAGGNDYTLAGTALTLNVALSGTWVLLAWYRYAGSVAIPNFADEEIPTDSGDHQHFTLANAP